MARITVEDCLAHCDNMYQLVLLATKRTRQLYRGVDPLVRCKNRQIVTSLREIASGKVRPVKRDPSTADDDELSSLTN